jgi:tetratricopeptide (TPR) repeat protein
MKKNRKTGLPFLKNWNFPSGIIEYVILAVVPLLLYMHAVNFGYSGFDDEEIIAHKIEVLKKVENLPLAFQRDAFMNIKGDSFYRPMGNISFMIDAIIGGGSLVVFHAHNIVLHVLALMLALYLFVLLGLNKRISFFILLIFSVHPLFTHAVCWIPSRMDLLLTVFSISSFIMFVKYLLTEKKRFIIFHLLFFALAVFSKETALILPIMLFIYYYLFSPAKQKKDIAGLWLSWLLLIVAYMTLRAQVLHDQTSAGYFNILASLKNLQVIPTILAKLLFPINLSTMPRFEIIFVLIGTCLIIGMLILICRKKQEANKILIYGLIWYVIASLPPLLYTNPMSEFGFNYLEHRGYLPLLGTAMFLIQVLQERRIPSRNWKIAVPFLVVVLSAITFANSYSYTSPMDFFTSAIQANPQCAMAYNSRSMYKFSSGDPIGAENDLNASLAITPKYAPAWNNKAAFFLHESQYDSAIITANKALMLNPSYSDAFVNRAIAKTNLGEVAGAIHDYRMSIKYDSTVDYVYYNLGNLYATQGLYVDAIRQYTKAIVNNPQYLEALNNRANIRLRVEDFNGALDDCKKVLSLEPNYPRAFYNKAKAYIGLKMPQEALEAVNSAILIDSTYSAANELRVRIIQEYYH